jgi:hypothetical protein
MKQKILKIAALEPTTHTDPRTGRMIRVSTSVRMKYREYFKSQMLNILPNRELNEIIANDFIASAEKVAHMSIRREDSDLTAHPPKISWLEFRIQNRGPRAAFNFFVSIIRDASIDIITVKQSYIKPTKPRIVDLRGG